MGNRLETAGNYVSNLFFGRESGELRMKAILTVTEGGGTAGFGVGVASKQADIVQVIATYIPFAVLCGVQVYIAHRKELKEVKPR